MDATRKKVNLKINLIPQLRSFAQFAFALLLGLCEVKSGVYPFGLAYLCASELYVFPVFLGVFASAVITGFGRYAGVPLVMAIFAVKWITVKKTRKQSYVLKICLGFFAAAAVTACEFAERNAIFESSVESAALILILPVCTLLFCGQSSKGKIQREITVLAYAFIVTKALGWAMVGSLSTAAVAAAFITLYAARSGYIFGGLCGFAAGMAAGVEFLPILGLMGICFGIFYENGRVFSAVFAYLLSVSVGTYLVGIENSIPGILNPLIGVLLFLLLANYLPDFPSNETLKRKLKPLPLAKLGGAFSSLSSVFYTVSENTAVETKHILGKRITERVVALCQNCGGCECDKYDLANHMNNAVNKKGIMFFEDLPLHVRGMCRRGGELLYAANSVQTETELNGIETIKTLAGEYLSFSRLLCSVNEKSEEEIYCESGRNKKTAELLAAKGINFRALTVTGKRKINLVASGVKMESLKCSPAELSESLSELLSANLSEPEITQNGTELHITSLPKIRVECAKASFNKNGETVCGDTVSFFETDGGIFYALISDGMGSGRDAALTSRLAAIFLEKLLTVGADKNEVLNLLNKMLILKNQEIFTTIDLLEIDKLTGEASLVKAGAAPTFLYRGETCFRLEAKTPPAGIMNELQAVQTKLKVTKGDLIVMLSDGLLPSDERPQLPNRGKSSAGRTAASLAASILEKWGAEGADDDRSVCVIRVF